MEYVQYALAGLSAAGAYALSGVGMVTIFKATRVVNFAQGAIGMVGAYLFFDSWLQHHDNYLLGAFLGILTSTVVGLLFYLLAMVPLGRASGLTKMIATIGGVVFLGGLATLVWGTKLVPVRPLFSGTVHIGTLRITGQSLLSISVAFVFTVALGLFFSRAKLGKVMEATSSSVEGTERFGYNTKFVGAVAWAFGSAAAGTAAVLVVPDQGLTQSGLTFVVISAMVSAMVGGFNRIWVAFGAGAALGIVQALLVASIPSVGGLQTAVPLGALILALSFGADAIPGYRSDEQRPPKVPRTTIRLPAVAGAVGLATLAIAFFNTVWQGLLVQAAGMAIVCCSQVLVLGYLGQPSLMQWSFAGLGGFTAGAMVVSHGAPFWVGVVVGAAAAGLLAVAIGSISLRLMGVAFAVTTITAVTVMQQLVLSKFGAGAGYSLHRPFSPRVFSTVAVVAVAAVGLGMYFLRQGAAGKRILAVRGSQRAAAAVGLNTFTTKVLTFGLSGALAGLGGVIYCFGVGTVDNTLFDPLTALLILAITFINGIGSITAGITAGASIVMGQYVLTDFFHVSGSTWFQIAGGVGLVFTLIRYPDGAFLREKAGRRGPVEPIGEPRVQPGGQPAVVQADVAGGPG